MTKELKVLYKDDRITIAQTNVPGEHDVIAGISHCYLSRGILEQLCTKDASGLRNDLYNVNSDFLFSLRHQRISLEQLGWAIAKARINELEQEVGYHIREYNELKARTD